MFRKLLKTRKVSFPYTLTTFDEAVIKETQVMEKCSREEALAQIFSVGIYLHIENLNRELHVRSMIRYRELCKKENELSERVSAVNRKNGETPRNEQEQDTAAQAETKSQAPETPRRKRERRAPNIVIPEKHLRFFNTFISSKRRNAIRFSKTDSERLIKAGYLWYKYEISPNLVRLSLFREITDTTYTLNKCKYPSYSLLAITDERVLREVAGALGVAFFKDKAFDVPYSISEGRGCLCLEIKRPRTPTSNESDFIEEEMINKKLY